MTKKSQKILSISVAAYNLGEMIEDNLKSFCDSRYIDDIEVLVVDDGSSDDTPKRVEKYVKKYPDSVRLIKQANAGPGSTVNTGIKNATGKYVVRMDAHASYAKDYISKCIEYLKKINFSNKRIIISSLIFDIFNQDDVQKAENSKFPFVNIKRHNKASPLRCYNRTNP